MDNGNGKRAVYLETTVLWKSVTVVIPNDTVIGYDFTYLHDASSDALRIFTD